MQEANVNKMPTKIKGYVKSIIDKEGYLTYNVDFKNLQNGSQFLGQLYTIDVDGQTIDGDKEINLFIKEIVDNKDGIKIVNVNDLYHKEYFAYTELLMVLKELQDEVQIPVIKRFDTAINYDALTSETIILENLTKRGFITYYRMDVAPLTYAELCMQQLAKFHSLTFVLQARRPTFFDKIKTMKHAFIFGEDWNGFARNVFNVAIAYLEDDVRRKVAQKISDIVNKYPVYMNDTTTVCTLSHGDYRKNNIMVKETNGEASEVIPVDFQLLHYGSPVHDIIYFMFLSTDHKFRELHMEHLKTVYYQNCMTFLEHFQINMESVYSRAEFEKDFKGKLDFGLMISILIAPFVFYTERVEPDLSEELSNFDFYYDEKFRERFRGTVEDFIKWGYL